MEPSSLPRSRAEAKLGTRALPTAEIRRTVRTLVASSLRRIVDRADRAEAGAFATVDTWVASLERPEDEELRLWVRVLISVAKAVSTRETPGRDLADSAARHRRGARAGQGLLRDAGSRGSHLSCSIEADSYSSRHLRQAPVSGCQLGKSRRMRIASASPTTPCES